MKQVEAGSPSKPMKRPAAADSTEESALKRPAAADDGRRANKDKISNPVWYKKSKTWAVKINDVQKLSVA